MNVLTVVYWTFLWLKYMYIFMCICCMYVIVNITTYEEIYLIINMPRLIRTSSLSIKDRLNVDKNHCSTCTAEVLIYNM